MALVLNHLIFFPWTEDSTVIFHQRDVDTPPFPRLQHICSLRACCLVEMAGGARLAHGIFGESGLKSSDFQFARTLQRAGN